MSAERVTENSSSEVKEASELDKWFGPREEQVVVQDEFIILPNFESKALVEGTLDKLAFGQEIIRKEGYAPLVPTNISQIEVIFPWLLHKAELIKDPLPEWQISGEVEEASITGTMLHAADALFNAVSRGIRGNSARTFFPSYKKEEELDGIKYALNGVDIDEARSREDLEKIFRKAWLRYKSVLVPSKGKNLVLPGFGVVDPKEEELFIKGPEIDQYAILLARAWAREMMKEGQPMTWEFASNVITQREVLVIDNMMGPGLQFRATLDSISRRADGGKVTSQLIDLKTGKSEFKTAMEQQIHKRQSQTMLHLAERFTANYLREFKSLKPREEAFFVKTLSDSKAFVGRVRLAGYRYFDKETGKMRLERINMTPAERKDFNVWLSWYGAMIQLYKGEIKDLLRTKTSYKISEIDTPYDWKF